MADEKIRIRLRLQLVSYAHIASGEWLDPTQYTISNNRLYVFNQAGLITYLNRTHPAELHEVVKQGYHDIARFMSRYFDPAERDTWVQSHPVDEAEQKKYLADLENPAAQMLVSVFIRNSLTGAPYIPGSSLKGAIRTALVYDRYKSSSDLPRRRDGAIDSLLLEPHLFRYFNQNGRTDVTLDPFKHLKVSDAVFRADNLRLRVVENLKATARTPQNSRHKDGELNYRCQVLVKGVETEVQSLEFTTGKLGLNSVDELIQKNNRYFSDRLLLDQKYFYARNGGKEIFTALQGIVNALKPRQFLIRMGRGVGSIPKSLDKPLNEPITRNLVGGLPMGICRCTIED